LKDSESAAVKM